MAQGRVGRDAVGIAWWAFCLTLGALVSVGVCEAEQSATASAPRPGAQIGAARTRAPQIQAPIDSTMARLRLLEGAAAPAASVEAAQSSVLASTTIRARNIRRSRYSGFTQSQTVTAWCGHNVAMAFNDTGVELTTIASGRGVSMDGYSAPSDRGATFTHMGSPATPDDPNTFT